MVYVCPACGAQVSDRAEGEPAEGYKRGHYHSPPVEDWSGEDPFFEARRLVTVGLPTLEQLGGPAPEDVEVSIDAEDGVL